MIVEADGYQIDFKDAIGAFKFDETDKTKPTYHGATVLKAVDVIAEFDSAYVFVEIKDYDTPEDFDELSGVEEEDIKVRQAHFKWLKNYLKYKFRDSFLYRHAENKVDKPIHYLCLLNFDNALNTKMTKSLKNELPVGKKSSRWANEISKSCNALNLKKWNEEFPKWPAQRMAAS
jgi:hypothetical protein